MEDVRILFFTSVSKERRKKKKLKPLAEYIVRIKMQPTQETKDILSRWEEVSSRKSGDGKGKNSFPKDGKLNYIDLYKKFQETEFGSVDDTYITEGK
ncbi:hypothetical protein HBP65_09430 [Listeria welshimeri]|uniref:hypothetical protein n=1 Tax=Listeria welshimeri TaxID=1643 RepID=UPI001627CBCF|nr:hypothetical protein [Listeria welshimeri]MBC1705503.1 hypothetical protein [Listeria welshimeri]MBC1864159.1 hypothetical protein [Listeria welshimeri]MBC2357331.1 hypothetical protein [Listeria welshimeri]MBF2576008.1 hypothetical protein [Listeria welshimeri]